MENIRPDNFDIHELIEDLRGTCATIQEKLPDGMSEDELTDIDTATLDGEIMRCECCSWWCDTDEMTGDGFCPDCVEESEEDAE